jgi:hypothetical protein
MERYYHDEIEHYINMFGYLLFSAIFILSSDENIEGIWLWKLLVFLLFCFDTITWSWCTGTQDIA